MKGAEERKRLSDYIPGSAIYDLCFVENSGSNVVLKVPSSFLKEYLSLRANEIEKIFGRPLKIEVDESIAEKFAETEEEPSGTICRWGYLIGDHLNPDMSPNRFIVASNNQRAYELCNKIMKDGKGSIVVYGISGVGKTHLLHVIAWQLLYSGQNVAYFKSYSLIDAINKAFRERSIDRVKEAIFEADALLIDDFQNFNYPQLSSVRNFLFSVIDFFTSSNRMVVVTSDVEPNEINWKRIEERIRQRLLLRGKVAINPPGSDFAVCYVEHRLKELGIVPVEEALEAIANFRFKSVRELESLAWSLTQTGRKVIGKEDVEAVVQNVSMFSRRYVSKLPALEEAWRKTVHCFFDDPFTVDRILRGESLSRSTSRRLSQIRKIFAKVAVEAGYRKSQVADFFGLHRCTLTSWEKRMPVGREAEEIERIIQDVFSNTIR